MQKEQAWEHDPFQTKAKWDEARLHLANASDAFHEKETIGRRCHIHGNANVCDHIARRWYDCTTSTQKKRQVECMDHVVGWNRASMLA